MVTIHMILLRFRILAMIVIGLLFSACTEPESTQGTAFPPINSFLADSAWPISHGHSYAQGSSPLPGPSDFEHLRHEYVPVAAVSIVLAYSGLYPDGGRVIWGSNMFEVFKLDAESSPLTIIAQLSRDNSVLNPMAGSYTVVDAEGTFFVPSVDGIYAYVDKVPDDRHSGILERSFYELPEAERFGDVVGINMTYDGWLVFATSGGTVGVVARDFSEYEAVQTAQTDEEEVSNSIAVDEDGGIYVVSSTHMQRIQWTGERLSLDESDGAWRAAYPTGADEVGGRLGIGSGSTPSLMGVGDDDRFVVITDGRELMHLMLFWRAEIPDDWLPIAEGYDRRIAAEFPVTFGDTAATHSVSEQSVLVQGYRAVVVSNDYGDDAPVGMLPVLMGLPAWGIEQFEWDPVERRLTSNWANPEVGCPNGIPTMSSATGLFYCIGKRGEEWTLEALHWENGESAGYFVLGPEPHHNTVYAATQIGQKGNIITGTTNGVTSLLP